MHRWSTLQLQTLPLYIQQTNFLLQHQRLHFQHDSWQVKNSKNTTLQTNWKASSLHLLNFLFWVLRSERKQIQVEHQRFTRLRRGSSWKSEDLPDEKKIVSSSIEISSRQRLHVWSMVKTDKKRWHWVIVKSLRRWTNICLKKIESALDKTPKKEVKTKIKKKTKKTSWRWLNSII